MAKCTIQRLENTEGAITMYNPEVGEYRGGNQNVQSQRLENTDGAIKNRQSREAVNKR